MFEQALVTVATAATPLLLAATGELVVERSGTLNVSVEGTMLIGAVAGFAAAAITGSAWIGIGCAVFAGGLFSLLFGFLAITLAANQLAAGLAISLVGVGVSGMIGQHFVGVPGVVLGSMPVPVLSEVPVIGAVLFGQDPLVPLALLLLAGVSYFLFRTKRGLVLRAVGDNPNSANALGVNVARVRYAAIVFGGCCSGAAGGYLSLVYTPQWIENMTAGRGWIALALVVFASWRPARLLLGAYLFGAASVGQLNAQGLGVAVPSQLLSAVPYLATIVVLVAVSADREAAAKSTPLSLGRPFVPSK